MDLFDLIIVTAALAGGAIAKGATGMGLPLVALPALTAAFGLQPAIVILLVPILVTNAWQVYRYRAARHDDRLRFLAPMLLAGGVGVAFGTWALTTLPERALVLSLGIVLLAYLALRLARPSFGVDADTGIRLALPLGAAAGALQGATGISAPIGVTFIHAMRLDRPQHIFAVSAMFLAISVVQLPAVAVAGILDPVRLAQGLFALLPIAVFMPIGEWLARRASRATFDRLILAFLGVMGLKMVLGI